MNRIRIEDVRVWMEKLSTAHLRRIMHGSVWNTTRAERCMAYAIITSRRTKVS